MRYLVLLIIALMVSGICAQVSTLPTCYNTYAEITDMLFQYEELYPDHAKVHLIGYSQLEHIPIYGIKLSSNVLQDGDKPALLFIGQVHAEEVLGVQITLSNIKEILENRMQSTYLQWLGQLEIWFVPTLNPEGHNVVTANIDTSYRKNKRDNNNNGVFDFSPQVGYDIDGVDINRNFEFNWVHGDTLLYEGGLEWYDYYRGPAPMSEPEVQGIQALFEQKKFAYSIVWHSSRTGNLSEKVYYSFNWKEVRPSPDVSLAQSIAQGVAGQIMKENGSGYYEAFPNLSRKGCFHDWAYQQYGTIQLLIECGTEFLQPDSLLMVNTVQRCSNGVRWLIHRAMPIGTAVPSHSMLTGIVKDADTQEPLQAQVEVVERNAPWFKPRTSKAATGRYWRPIAPGSYTLLFRKKGYQDLQIQGVTVNNTSWTLRNANLQKKADAVFSGWVRSGNEPIPAKIVLHDVEPDTLITNGDFLLNTYEGTYNLEVTSEGYHPYFSTVDLVPGQNSFYINLSPVETFFSEDWESGTAGWVIEGPWARQNALSASGYALTDSWGGNGFYAMNCDVHITSANPIQIPSNTSAFLRFDHHLHTEWIHDIAQIQISTDGESWQTLWSKSGKYDFWHREYVSLNSYLGQMVYLRFRLTDQSIHEEFTDPGWTIDNIAMFSGDAVAVTEQLAQSPVISALYPNYPNPFNPSTSIKYSIAKASNVKLEIFNLKGQKVKTLVNENLPRGNFETSWDGTDQAGRKAASGIYLYRLQSDGHIQSRKMIMMK